MNCASAISDATDAVDALEAVAASVANDIGASDVALAVIFTSLHPPDRLEQVARRMAEFYPNAVTLGCTGEGTIGSDREIERAPSLSMFAAQLPGVDLQPFLLRRHELEVDPDWIARLGVQPEDRPATIALIDPFSFPADAFLDAYNVAYPGCPLIGGMASGATAPGGNRLLLNGASYEEGAVGVRVSGNIEVECVVSQGCRPVGRSFIVTSGEGNVIRTLAGRPAMEVIEDMMVTLPAEDQRLLRFGIFLGTVIDEYRQDPTRGDFLVRNVIGADPQTKAIALAGEVRKGTTVQFHVRDAESADEDLRELLDGCAGDSAAGALLFSCNGRGTRMWTEPGHDVRVVRELCHEIPTAGFFCGGEIGPIGGQVFLHGLTASVGILRPAR